MDIRLGTNDESCALDLLEPCDDPADPGDEEASAVALAPRSVREVPGRGDRGSGSRAPRRVRGFATEGERPADRLDLPISACRASARPRRISVRRDLP